MAGTDKDDIAAILKKNGCTYDNMGNLTTQPGADKCHDVGFYKDVIVKNIEDLADSFFAKAPKDYTSFKNW
jgi:hypothetical protein